MLRVGLDGPCRPLGIKIFTPLFLLLTVSKVTKYLSTLLLLALRSTEQPHAEFIYEAILDCPVTKSQLKVVKSLSVWM